MLAERGRYVLGEEEDRYGIWDLDAESDEPIERFEMADDGFEAAWNRLRALHREDRDLLGRVLSWSIALGIPMWILGTVLTSVFYIEVVRGSTLDVVLRIAYIIEPLGFRLAMGGILGLLARHLVGYLRREPVPPLPVATTKRDDLLRNALFATLAIWIATAFFTPFYQPTFETQGDEAWWMLLAQVIQFAAFRASILLGAIIALRLIRAPRATRPET